ncbi:polyphenol oxidase I, chloroplastic-like protein [Tanacetum coccineum]
MTIPKYFKDPKMALFDSKRNQDHVKRVVDLGYNGKDTDATDLEKVKNNLAIMYRQMVTNATDPTMFFGGQYRAGIESISGGGSVEQSPHTLVHRWVGDPRETNGENLGNFYSTGRDTPFYCHHSNVDRMWSLWKMLGGIRNVPPNGVFGNDVYGSDSEKFGMNPSSNEFRLCNSDEWRSRNHGGRVIICGYGGGGNISIESFVPMETEARVKRYGLQLEQEQEQETSKKQKIDIEDASITKGKNKDYEFNKEREHMWKDKVPSASSEIESGVDAYSMLQNLLLLPILKDFLRDDLIELYRLVIKKYGANRPEEMYDRVLWGDLKTMFDPPLSDDAIWSLPLQQKIINWRYYPTCVVHCLTLDASTIYMLADRKYPLSKDACQVMLKMKLLDGTMDEVCYQLLKMIEKQAGIRK